MRRWMIVMIFLLAGCSAPKHSIPVTGKLETATPSAATTGGLRVLSATLVQTSTPTATLLPEATETPEPTASPEPTLAPSPTPSRLPAERWKEWPVIPALNADLIDLYREGLARGSNPHAFSVLGDCQSEPEVFMGIYEYDPQMVLALPPNLQETVAQFDGSFNRYSPTVRSGTTAGALLWAAWNNDSQITCERNETPIDCELRIQQPSIVIIQLGTHWEARNERYLTLLIERIFDAGAVPVLATKADNREGDDRINRQTAELAEQFDLPMWNLWAAVQDLPNSGMVPGSDMYLTQAGLDRKRLSALQALDAVWRAASAHEGGQP